MLFHVQKRIASAVWAVTILFATPVDWFFFELAFL